MDDPLSTLVQSSGLRPIGIVLWEQASSESMRFPGSMHTAIHVVIEGRAVVHLSGEGTIPLEEGQLFLLPKDQPHVVSAGPIAGKPMGIESAVLQQRVMAEFAVYLPVRQAHTATILTTAFRVPASEQVSLFDDWPTHCTLPGTDPPLLSLVHAIAMMARVNRPGKQLAASRLAEGLLMMALGQAVTGLSSSPQMQRALPEPGLQRALLAIQEDLARPWTVQSLARKAGMSRTLFARRFHEALGVTVANYLRRQRIQRAQELLANPAMPVETVCGEVGFSSVSSFSRAFLKLVGVRPGEFARKQTASLIGLGAHHADS